MRLMMISAHGIRISSQRMASPLLCMPRYGLIFGAEQDDDGIDRIKAHQKAVLLVTAGLGHSRAMDGIVASFRINF
ncbi:hypothetical protein [Pseudoramibacter faecis]|uniref:hypothetical protein n=1 Tax=Pseudoramibacter faecis TaxID=3108534 RepID=UPI002E7905EE|nr:hypothetical protein [Pseudoramibacter sp. HA2172]